MTAKRRPIALLSRALPLAVAGLGWALRARAGLTEHPQTTLAPHSDLGDRIKTLFFEITWWEIGIFVVVTAALVTALIRFRARPGREAAREVHGHSVLEFSWTLAPAIVLAFIAVPTVRTIFHTQAPAPPGALRIEVIGHQWWWEFRYPELGVVTANEMHVPVGRPVGLELTSADVIHSFWVPALGAKRDLQAGHKTHIWFTARTPGEYRGQCAEFCGASHANMRVRAVVDSPDAFAAWAAAQKQPPVAQADTTAEAALGLKVFTGAGLCFTCHVIQGVSAPPLPAGPNLTHLASRGTIAGATLERTPENLERWIKDPPAAKPGALMPKLPLTDVQIKQLVAYLETLR